MKTNYELTAETIHYFVGEFGDDVAGILKDIRKWIKENDLGRNVLNINVDLDFTDSDIGCYTAVVRYF